MISIRMMICKTESDQKFTKSIYCWLCQIHMINCITVTLKGDLKDNGTVWYHPMGIAIILSLKNVKKKFLVTYDRSIDESYFITEDWQAKHGFVTSNGKVLLSCYEYNTTVVLVTKLEEKLDSTLPLVLKSARTAKYHSCLLIIS